MKFARCDQDGLVLEVFSPQEPWQLLDCFTTEVAAQFISCPDEVQGGWTLQSDGTFVEPLVPEPPPATAEPEPESERARNEDGTFVADDPATPDVDEAWQSPQ